MKRSIARPSGKRIQYGTSKCSARHLVIFGAIVVGVATALAGSNASAQAAPQAPKRQPPARKKTLATPELINWLTKLIKDNLPPSHEDDKNWGQTKKVWNGIKLRREGLKLETERRIRTVKTGTWTRYRVDLVEPEKNLDIQFHRLQPMEDGKVKFEVSVGCPLDVFGRLSQWVRDVQVISISANADAACRMTVTGTVGVKMNVFKFPPDLTLEPKVETAHVALTHYEVQRLSQVRGEFAEILGDGLKGVIDKKLERFNNKLVDKMNKQIAKQSDKLSFSPQEWLKNKLPLPPAKKPTAGDAAAIAPQNPVESKTTVAAK